VLTTATVQIAAPTPRQLRLICLHSVGKTFDEIAAEEHISYGLVRSDLDRLRATLNAKNLSQAVIGCIARGFIAVDGRTECTFVVEEDPELVAA
jgi:DNA-binding CsgD family transcriptional regulator